MEIRINISSCIIIDGFWFFRQRLIFTSLWQNEASQWPVTTPRGLAPSYHMHVQAVYAAEMQRLLESHDCMRENPDMQTKKQSSRRLCKKLYDKCLLDALRQQTGFVQAGALPALFRSTCCVRCRGWALSTTRTRLTLRVQSAARVGLVRAGAIRIARCCLSFRRRV